MKTVKIAGGQGFYGDSPNAAVQIAKAKGADYIVHDALAELTLSILQKDKLQDASLGYARDIELLATSLYPLAYANGIKIVSNSGGLNPVGAAKKVAAILAGQGIKGYRIAVVTGDDMLPQLKSIQDAGILLENLDSGKPFSENKYEVLQSNVYTGAKSIADALAQGANLVLAGRVADPCLTLGVLVHHFGWKIGEGLSQQDLDRLASGIAVGHLLECGGQASGGNSYAEWPMNYSLSNLAYPIAEVAEDGSVVFSILEGQGGKMSRNTLREQLIYEIHDPANYITPDVIVDLTRVKIEDIGPNRVRFAGAKGKSRPGKLKLTIGLMEGYMSEQFFFFSWPYAYEKTQRFIETAKEIWSKLPLNMERFEFQLVGLNGIHGAAAPMPPKEILDELNEIGVRVVIKHNDNRTGKMALQSLFCLGLNGPPGLIGMPGWGKQDKVVLSLWPSLIPRNWVEEKTEMVEV